MTRVLVLGLPGMLGSVLAAVLAEDPDVEVVGTVRSESPRPAIPSCRFDARRDDVAALLDEVEPAWVVNAIGILKSRIEEGDPASIEEALAVNAAFPFRLTATAQGRGARVIQIATDGVFSGRAGPSTEESAHDPVDVYGKTKSLGEVPSPAVLHLRCSIVGEEREGRSRSLIAWILGQERGARLRGFTDHRFNGLTTLAFARLCTGAIREELSLPSPLHVVPGDVVSKADLLELVADVYGRTDLVVERGPGPAPSDRSLTTVHPGACAELWKAAGYPAAPTVEEMVSELAVRGRDR